MGKALNITLGVVGTIAAIGIVSAAVSGNSTPAPAIDSVSDSGSHTIVLQATLGQKSTVEYYIDLGEHRSQVVPAGKTWKLTLHSDDEDVWLTVTPVDTDVDGKDDVCKITIDGHVRAESSNPFIASCNS